MKLSDPRCSDCKHFEYDEIWNGQEEVGFCVCHKERYNDVGWWNNPCSDFEDPDQ